MTPERWQQVKSLCQRALDRDAREREAFLLEACPNDPELLRDTRALLEQATLGEGVLDAPFWQKYGFAAENAALQTSGRWLPESVGRYRVLRLIGEGGMGSVYEAEQDHPRRVVALKVIRPGFTSPPLLRRFERESQALGRLQHPGIAQIYDAGTADSGFGPQPSYAMEFILGETLTDYAAVNELGTRRRLELMTLVCDAVQHAHERGLIHRDLKPGNILVDRTGQPKILDFGVARLTDPPAHATQTDAGQLVGTLAYMSPERVLADPKAMDARSDVYALGVILYELLARRLPYVIGSRVHEAVQMIRDEDPARLSSVDRTFRGDIETIVSKALEKDKTRRYESAAALADDIRRYLSDQPIAARSASATYQLQKFARRHKALVGGMAAVFVVLVAGVVVSGWQARRARQAQRQAVAAEERVVKERDEVTKERNRAVAAQELAQQERNQALTEKQRADTEAETAKAVSDFLQRDLLAQASARVQASGDTKPDPDLKVRSVLDRAAARLGDNFKRQPLVEASIRQTIGGAYRDLGLYPQAREHLLRAYDLRKAALGENDPATTEVLGNLAGLYAQDGKYPQAEALYKKTIAALRLQRGDDHPEVLAATSDLAQVYQFEGHYAEAAALIANELTTERRVLGPDHPTTLLTAMHLADAYHFADRDADALLLYEKTLQAQRRVLGADHPDTLATMVNLANSYADQQKIAESERLFLEALHAQQRVLGASHPETLVTMADLALMYKNHGHPEKAEPLYLEVLSGRRRLLGEEHPDTLIIMNNLGAFYSNQRRFAEAEPLFDKVLEARKRILGPDHQYTLNTMTNLAQLYDREGKKDQAERAYVEVLARRQRVMGRDHADSRLIMNNLGLFYFRTGKPQEGESMLTELLEIQRRKLGDDHPDTLKTADNLAVNFLQQQRYRDVEKLLADFIVPRRKDAVDSWYRYNTASLLGAALSAEKKYDEAEKLLLDGYKGLSDRQAATDLNALEQSRQRIIQLYQSWGKPERAEEWRTRLAVAR